MRDTTCDFRKLIMRSQKGSQSLEIQKKGAKTIMKLTRGELEGRGVNRM